MGQMKLEANKQKQETNNEIEQYPAVLICLITYLSRARVEDS